MGEEIGRNGDAISGSVADDISKLHRVPEDNNGGQQVHAGDAIMLPFARSVPDFAAPMEADGALQRMVGFAFVEADLGLALQAGVENPPANRSISSKPPCGRAHRQVPDPGTHIHG